MTSATHEFRRHADVLAALAEPRLIPVPAANPSAAPGTVAWLRATVARFSSGADHARRRALVEADLARLDPAALHRAAALAAADADPRSTVVTVLAEALELPEPAAVARAVCVVAGAYFGREDREDLEHRVNDDSGAAGGAREGGAASGGSGSRGDDGQGDAAAEAAADAAVAWLLPRVAAEGSGSEEAANRIGLLVQACDATGRLVENARRRPPGPGDLLIETLRHDPPVREIRRIATGDVRIAGTAIARGDLVVLAVAADGRDPQASTGPAVFAPATPATDATDATNQEPPAPQPPAFGAAPRLCPGRDHALALAAGILGRDVPDHDPSDSEPTPDDGDPDANEDPEGNDDPDGRDPAELLAAMTDRFLALAETWTAWDGKPVPVDDRVYTPHKSIRRICDHLVDHLAELEARLVGEEPQADHWHASTSTTAADLAPFTEKDLDEARSRLTRLTRIWVARLGALTPDQLDRSPGQGWTFRRLALHLTGSIYYADAIGDLRGPAAEGRPTP